MTMRTGLITIAAAVALAAPAAAQKGPVAAACKDEIASLCAGKSHAQREIRNCLEANKDKVSASCKAALDSTGPGKGMRGMGGMGGMGRGM